MAAAKKPAEKPEDAIWRHITDLHRKHTDMETRLATAKEPQEEHGEQAVMGLVAAAGMIEARIQQSQAETCAALEPLRKAIEGDAQRDAEVAQMLRENTTALHRLAEAIEVMTSPRTRTGVVDLPTGRVQMTITEAHDKRKGH